MERGAKQKTEREERLGIVAAKGTTKLNAAKTEFVAQPVRSFGEFFQFFAALRFEEVKLLRTV